MTLSQNYSVIHYRDFQHGFPQAKDTPFQCTKDSIVPTSAFSLSPFPSTISQKFWACSAVIKGKTWTRKQERDCSADFLSVALKSAEYL